MGGRKLAGLAIVALLLLWLLPELYPLIFATHPVTDGTELVFAVDEVLGPAAERTYGVKMRFRAREQGGFRLDVLSPHGVRSLNLEEDSLQPTADRDNDKLEVVTESGMEVAPAMVWLPPDRRTPGKNCLTGLVMGIEGFGGRRAWQVMHPDGMVYFDVDTGILSGFELEYGRTRMSGRLRRMR